MTIIQFNLVATIFVTWYCVLSFRKLSRCREGLCSVGELRGRASGGDTMGQEAALVMICQAWCLLPLVPPPSHGGSRVCSWYASREIIDEHFRASNLLIFFNNVYYTRQQYLLIKHSIGCGHKPPPSSSAEGYFSLALKAWCHVR